MLHHHAPTIFAFAAGLVTAGAPLLSLWRRDHRSFRAAIVRWDELITDARAIADLRRRAQVAESALAERAVADALTGPEMAVL